jgi:hypothetical protein
VATESKKAEHYHLMTMYESEDGGEGRDDEALNEGALMVYTHKYMYIYIYIYIYI